LYRADVPVLAALGLVATGIAIRYRRRRAARRWATGAAIGLFILAAAVLVVA
jgi:hypothetical protein